MTKPKSKPTSPSRNNIRSTPEQAYPFVEHLHELRRRLLFVLAALVAGMAVAYNFHEPLTRALLAPAEGQKFIYTSPGGGLDFLFRLCLYGGLVLSIPVIAYQLLRYLQPLIRSDALRFVRWGAGVSVLLTVAGIAFGYLLGLPAALHFLLHSFSSDQITPLITIQSYMSFVLLYLLASSMLFQMPLLLLLINRIRPLTVRALMRYERWVILLCFMVSAVVSPTPDAQNLLLLSLPMIAMYQVGVGLVWLSNRKSRARAA
jgi:sec-independent protein translocase protein TatC